MTGHRPERVADLVHRILADVVRERVRDPRVGFVTLTEVRVTPDLRRARVYVSKLGDGEQRADSVDALNHAAAFLRREVAHRAGLKRVPDLEFVEDRALETGMSVEGLLDELHGERDDGPGDGDE
jgi:ribosome-binding factor A